MRTNIYKRIIGGLIFFGLIIAFLALRMVSVRFFDGFIMLMAVVAAVEITRALNVKNDRTESGECSLFFVLLALVLGYVGFVFFNLSMYLVGILVAIGCLYICRLFNKNITKQDAAATSFGMIYPNALFGFVFQLNSFSDASKLANPALSSGSLQTGLLCLAFLLLISSGSDIFALVFGLALGRKYITKKLCPKISPKKTVIGSVGGLFGGILGAVIVFVFAYHDAFGVKLFPISIWGNVGVYCLIGVFGSILTQAGDLIASMIKRSCGIKDFGYILLGHGGVMDRWDGVLFNALALYSFLSVFDLFIHWTFLY